MLSVEQSLIWISFMIAMTFFAYKTKIIDRYGAITAIPIGFIVLYFSEISWFFILLLFFITASIFTKYKYKQKQNMELSEQNSGARGWKSVLANGLPLASLAILYYLSGENRIFMLSFVGSVSFALSDTVATELGLLSKAKPRSILTGKEIDRGQSGGITIQGEIAAITCSLLIGSICGVWLAENKVSQTPIILIAAIFGGLIATNMDSIFGASIQAKYRCINCSRYLEKSGIHCNIVAIQEKGISFVDNNVVNFLGAIIGALVSASFIILYN